MNPMNEKSALPVAIVLCVIAVVVAWHYHGETMELREHKQTREAAAPISAPPIPTVQHELALGTHEHLRTILIPSAMLPDHPDSCLLYTNDATNAAIMQCRSWLGEWGHSAKE